MTDEVRSLPSSPLPQAQRSALLEGLYAVWECLDDAWGHTGGAIALGADGGAVPSAHRADVCTVCVLGAIERMLYMSLTGDRVQDAIEALAGPIPSTGMLHPLGAWSERSDKDTVMRVVGKAIADEEQRCRLQTKRQSTVLWSFWSDGK